MVEEFIYLDNSATTRLDPRVLDEMIPYLESEYANPASNHHFGRNQMAAIQKARNEVANFLNCSQKELVFTSGSTESLNIAIKGLASSDNLIRSKIVTISTEHKAVLDNCKYLESIGFEVIYLPVNKDGTIDIAHFGQEVDQNTLAVCAMLVNNETGVVHPMKKIANICHDAGALLICDATQASGKLPIDVKELDVDILTISAHKFHGPKGIGALFIKTGTNLSTVIHGGGQEHGLRSGTLNVPGIIGLGCACRLSLLEMKENSIKILDLRNRLESGLLRLKGTKINGHLERRCSHILNISFPDLDANVLIREAKNLAVSNGSACSSQVFEPSYVLDSMGTSREMAYGAIRFSLSKYTTREEVDSAIEIMNAWTKLL